MSKKKENKIDLDCYKEVLVNTDKKSSKDKKAKLVSMLNHLSK